MFPARSGPDYALKQPRKHPPRPDQEYTEEHLSSRIEESQFKATFSDKIQSFITEG